MLMFISGLNCYNQFNIYSGFMLKFLNSIIILNVLISTYINKHLNIFIYQIFTLTHFIEDGHFHCK